MSHLKRIHLLILILPFGSRWSARFRRHLERCPRCQAGMIRIEEARTATIPKENIGEAVDFWPEISGRLNRTRPVEPFGQRRGWRWALATAGLVLAAAAIGLFLFRQGTGDDPASAIKLRVSYATMYEKPAQAIIFHTQDVNRTFVWVEKQNSGEVL